MGEPFAGTPPPVGPEDRLDSWKEIAAYLSRDVTTVQRWEKREGMPVHRHLHDRMGSVYAFRTELDAWAQTRNLRAPPEHEGSAPPASTRASKRWTFVLVPSLAAIGVALVAGVTLWFRVTEFLWRSPIADAKFQRITDFDGVEQGAAVSRDGRFVAFLSDRDGQMDVWLTQVGSGQFHNLTRGGAAELLNPSVRRIFTSPAGRHGHFPLWAPDGRFIYFVEGSLPDELDIWRISPGGGTAERITSHNGRVSHPVLLNRRTLVYLASDPDGSGPWLHSMDVDRRIPHKLSSGIDRYTSLAASADGSRLVATVASPKRTLWRLPIGDSPAGLSTAVRLLLATGTGFSPRLGPNYLLYVAAVGTGNDGIWKLTDGVATELWTAPGARVVGGPAIGADGRHVAFSVQLNGRTFLYEMQADGTKARIVADSLELQGAPTWSPDGQSITTAAVERGTPRLFRVPLDGRVPSPLVDEYSVDPTWAPDGRFIVYSGPDVGTTFVVKAVTDQGKAHPLPTLTLTRGARHLAFLSGRRILVLMRGEIQHKSIDLATGAERQTAQLHPRLRDARLRRLPGWA